MKQNILKGSYCMKKAKIFCLSKRFLLLCKNDLCNKNLSKQICFWLLFLQFLFPVWNLILNFYTQNHKIIKLRRRKFQQCRPVPKSKSIPSIEMLINASLLSQILPDFGWFYSKDCYAKKKFIWEICNSHFPKVYVVSER